MTNYISIDIPDYVRDKYHALSYEEQQDHRITSCSKLTNFILNKLNNESYCHARNIHIYTSGNGSVNIIIGKYSSRPISKTRLVHFRLSVPGISYMDTFDAEYIVEQIKEYFDDPNND